MLLQALAQYADTRLKHQLDDPAFEMKRISYLLEIGTDGTFLGITDRQGEVRPGGKTQPPPSLLAPKSPVQRTAVEHPLLACDNSGYVLGFNGKHTAFLALLADAAAATGDAALQACVAFFSCPSYVDAARACLAACHPPL